MHEWRYYKKHPEWKWQKTEFWYSLNDEELDKLCTQHRFDRGHEGSASVEVRGKPVSAKSAKRTTLTGFPRTSMLAKPEWPRLKTVLSRKLVQFFIVERVSKLGFLSFSLGMIRLYHHVWTWYKSESATDWLVVGSKVQSACYNEHIYNATAPFCTLSTPWFWTWALYQFPGGDTAIRSTISDRIITTLPALTTHAALVKCRWICASSLRWLRS